MANKTKWTIKLAEISVDIAADGGFTAKVPLYDKGVKQGTLVWTMSDNRQMGVVFEQVSGVEPVDFSGGAWVKVI